MDEPRSPGPREVSPLISALRKILPEGFRSAEPMRLHTSIRIGGPAEVFCQVNSTDEWQRLWEWCQQAGVAWRLLGGGTNLLVCDHGLPGVTVRLAGTLRELRWEGDRVLVGAGAGLARLVKEATGRGMAGMEFAAGIPGSVGGAVVMNAGTNHGAVEGVLEEVILWSQDGTVRNVPAVELGLGYRSSRLQSGRQVVLAARFRLRPGDPAEIDRRITAQMKERRLRQPLDLPSAGSVFKNPPGDYAGRLIEAVGLKGFRMGDAAFSQKHANFIVNCGRATAANVDALMQLARERVRERFNFELEPEIRIWR